MFKLIIGLLFSIEIFSFGLKDEIDYKNKIIIKALEKFNAPKKLEALVFPGELKSLDNFEGKYFKFKSEDSQEMILYLYVGRVNSCRAGGCSAPGNNAESNFEYFDYFILFDSDYTVRLVKVFNYQASKGQEITIKGWLKQFEGYNGTGNLTVGKQIDGISGATISVYAITDDIQAKTKLLQQITQNP